jgi:hypothetical protein
VNMSKESCSLPHFVGVHTISGKCVISSTFVTLTPAASRLDAVPPVETMEYLWGQNIVYEIGVLHC